MGELEREREREIVLPLELDLTWNTQNADVLVGDYERGKVEKKGKEKSALAFSMEVPQKFLAPFLGSFCNIG
jgi:hypothetical protein